MTLLSTNGDAGPSNLSQRHSQTTTSTMAPKSAKNSLTIRLSESVVFLRGAVESTLLGRRTTREEQPAMLRGLLTLNLVKPTKISSIEITLEGKSQTAWPDGFGSRRIEVSEEHEIFNATTVFFCAGSPSATPSGSQWHHPPGRRTASVGPGLTLDIEEDELEHELDSSSGHDLSAPRTPPQNIVLSRRVSMDHHNLQSHYVSHHVRTTHSPTHTGTADIPTPPYSPSSSTPQRPDSSTSAWSGSLTSPGIAEVNEPSAEHEHMVDMVHSPASPGMHHRRTSDSQSTLASSSSENFSLDDGLVPGRSSSDAHAQPHPRPAITISPDATSPNPPPSIHSSLSHQSTSSPVPLSPVPSTSTAAVSLRNHDASRERRHHSRFSLASMTNVLDAVKERVTSPINSAKEHAHSQNPGPSREHSLERVEEETERRGRGRERDRKEKSAFGLLTELLGADGEAKAVTSGDGWKEFRKGTYTYPISFAIPANSPPTLSCDCGTVSYRLKAVVHRPGTFTPRITASHEVTLIASPGEDDADESDNIVVQREWETQMHYMIVISGRMFAIGESVPLQITWVPMSGIKVYRLSAFLEERIDYYTQFKRIARSDPVKRFELLSCRYPDKEPRPILPLPSPEAYASSPLRGLIDAPCDDMAAAQMCSPGPWSIVTELQLPTSCSRMHFTNRHKRSNISVGHTLKIVMRVERGDDAYVDLKSGKRKHFDIVVQTPLHILSCRCSPEWTSLPRYTFSATDQLARTQSCPCTARRKQNSSVDSLLRLAPSSSRRSLGRNASASGSSNADERGRHAATTTNGRVRTSPPSRTRNPSSDHPAVAAMLMSPSTSSIAKPPLDTIPDSSPSSPQRMNPPYSHQPYMNGIDLARYPSHLSRFSQLSQTSQVSLTSETESLYRRNNQFARLVAGEESEFGEAPPRYEHEDFGAGYEEREHAEVVR